MKLHQTLSKQQNCYFYYRTKTYSYDGKTGYLEAVPFIDNNGNVLLPLRAVAGTLNIDAQNIIWDTQTQTITIKQAEKTICYTIGSNVMTINGVASQMNTAPIIQNGVTFYLCVLY